MKILPWNSCLHNLFLGLAGTIIFYYATCYQFNSITFAIQKNYAMATYYNHLGSELGKIGVVAIIIYFIHTFWTFKKLFSEDIKESKRPINIEFSHITHFLYSSKTQKEIFEPIEADWQEKYFEALFKKEIWKARWINVRYTYAFVVAMWQKSPIGDLIEFISKMAK